MFMMNLKFHFGFISISTPVTNILLMIKDTNIVLDNFTWDIFHIKAVFCLCKYNIECWLLLSNIL